ncbi:MAG: hypothetical protein ACTHOD_21885 [Motilibacteraceae bacterium]
MNRTPDLNVLSRPKEKIMARLEIPTELRDTLTDPKPLYAAVGATDLAARTLREASGKLAELRTEVKAPSARTVKVPGLTLPAVTVQPAELVKHLQERAAGLPALVQAQSRSLPAAAQDQAKELREDAEELPAKAVAKALELSARAGEVYDGLATRGKTVVAKIRRQESTQAAERQAEATVSKTKAAGTTARKSAASTRKATKAAGTSATRTARAAAKAAEEGVEKLG